MAVVPISGQVKVLAKKFPNGEVRMQTPRHLIWEMDITPSPNSCSYRIRIDYTFGSPPNTFVIEPTPLKKAEGARSLPHVFDDEKQQLCLYYGRIGGVGFINVLGNENSAVGCGMASVLRNMGNNWRMVR